MRARHALSRELLTYGAVGVVVYAVDLGVYAAITQVVPDWYVAANVVAKLAGSLTGFVLHRRFTFPGGQQGKGTHQLAGYLGLLAFNIVMASALLWLLVEMAALPALPAKIAVDIAVIICAYLGSRMIFNRV